MCQNFLILSAPYYLSIFCFMVTLRKCEFCHKKMWLHNDVKLRRYVNKLCLDVGFDEYIIVSTKETLPNWIVGCSVCSWVGCACSKRKKSRNVVVVRFQIGALRSNNGDVHENVADKQTPHHLKLFRHYPNSPCYVKEEDFGWYWREEYALKFGQR